VKLTFRGTRGSLASPRPETSRYGGNTACVELHVGNCSTIVLDAGTGIRAVAPPAGERVDILLSHLHMDHIVGLGFFRPLYQPDVDIHIWGPPSTTETLGARLSRYLSPPLFPVTLRELPCRLSLHDAPRGTFELPGVAVTAEFVCHPGPTLGYRLERAGRVLSYLSDHEPALGVTPFPGPPEWTSGFNLAVGADVLIHDAQYFDHEYLSHVGWGHSSIGQAVSLAEMAGVGRLLAFHHDPDHDDDALDRCYRRLATRRNGGGGCEVLAAVEGMSVDLDEPSM
jgi:phosphoribosyl 1,2-cyclic phosphodiesterase